MNRLETELRELFADKTSEVPALRDPMDSVVRQAQRVRRRQRAVVAAAVVVVVTATLLAGFSVTGHFRSTPPISPVPPAGSVELIVNDELVRQDGTRIPLQGRRHLQGAARTPAGLLYLDADGLLRLLRPDGTVVSYHEQLGRLLSFMVSPDGRSLAATRVSGNDIGVLRATLSAQHGIQTIKVMRGPAAVPQGWYGDHIVLRAVTESTRQRYGLWPHYAAGAQEWTEVKGIFLLRQSHDQRWYWGRRRGDDKKWCLVQLDPQRWFKVVAESCDLGLSKTSMMSISPDGLFLAISDPSEPRPLRIVDLASPFREHSTVWDRCPLVRGSPQWVSRNALNLYGAVCRLRPDGRVVVEALPTVPAGARVISVPSYGV